MPRTCGSCTFCCKVMGVREIEKPSNVWCDLVQIGKGCSIYDERPKSCRDFSCLWLIVEQIPEDFRPDISKFVISSTKKGDEIVIHVDENLNIKHNNKLQFMVRFLTKFTNVIIVAGEQRYLIEKGVV